MLCYFSLRPMRRHLTSSCYSMKLPAIMRCVYWVGVRTAGSFITIITKKKQRNQTIEFSWGLYCLVVLFLLVYVICASIPTKGTIKQGLTVLQTPHSVCSSHIFKMSDFKDQLFTCAGLPSDNIVEFSCGKKLFWNLSWYFLVEQETLALVTSHPLYIMFKLL